MKLFLSCEHAGNQVPAKYSYLFKNDFALLNTHRGYDKGAWELFKILRRIKAVDFSISNKITRLLVDLNRSSYRQNLFSEITKNIEKEIQTELLNKYYTPYRKNFSDKVADAVSKDEMVFHISVHAFAPEVDGKIRNCDIGILFDPRHSIERYMALFWRRTLKNIFPKLKIRYNYPFLGKPDGHVAPLRKQFGQKYVGFELELNSKHAGNIDINYGIKSSIERLYDLVNIDNPQEKINRQNYAV
ncbi:MAG: N-formylglutamate amidohydrolase [Marinilabiliaceae bacterium]|nr:N-formylglutamate amidohydrolase [Marinilabiliaceae bacterium]